MLYQFGKDFVDGIKKRRKNTKNKNNTIRHYTKKENIEKILNEGFRTDLDPLHGIGDLGITGKKNGGAKGRYGGEGTLYFTKDDNRWNNTDIFVGEGNRNITRPYYNYETQKWEEEENI